MRNVYHLLSDVSSYNTERFNPICREEYNYISTENMLENKNGVAFNLYYPVSGTVRSFIKNDILISNIRPYFKKIWFADRVGGCSDDILVIRAKNIYPKFLYYVLCDNNFFNYSTVTAKGTKMPRGSKDAIMKYLVPNVSIRIQEKIADILSTYDDLIENNNRRIEILEQMAQEIYKEWFVRFRFPGHEKVKFVNGLPEGWEVKKIKDFGNIITGKTPSTEVHENYGKDIMFIKTPDMHDTVFTTYSSEYLSEKGHLTQANKLIPANSILVSCIGTAGIVSINAEAAHTNQQINSIVLNDENLLYWLFYSCRFLKNTIELYGATGATMTNLSKGKFENLKILMPKQELVYLYNNKVNNIFSHIKKLLYLNQNLIKQRDLLLPRLMSGKLEV